MKRLGNASRRSLALICLLLVMLAARAAVAAAGRGEQNAWTASALAFEHHDWSGAEARFSSFMTNYPQSEDIVRAAILRAQAQYYLAEAGDPNPATGRKWRFDDVVDFVNGQLDRVGSSADQFLLWRGKAEYAGSNYSAAAATFDRISQAYPQSSYLAESLFDEADSCKQMSDWTRLLGVLASTNGLFQRQVRAEVTNQWVIQGLFLLAETQLQQQNFPAASDALMELPAAKLAPDLEWKRQYLAGRVPFEAGRFDEVLSAGDKLIDASASNPAWLAESLSLLGSAHKRLGQVPEAISNYDAILATNAPPKVQRQALLNIVDLLWASQQASDATDRLTDWMSKHPDDVASDFNLLTLGEMLLRQYYDSAETNRSAASIALLGRAQTNFVNLLQFFTNSPAPLRGKAELNLGWCYWAQSNFVDAGSAFSGAVQLLPPGESQAVALYKLGDCLSAQTNYPGAISNYSALIDRYGSYAIVSNNLFERALYQIVRAGTASGSTDSSAASNALVRIRAWFPDGLLGEPSVLLLGQAANRRGKPSEAHQILADFNARWPDSTLKPDVDLLIAHTFENEGDWSNVVPQYVRWIAANSNNPALPSAEYSLAYAYDRAGNRSQAFQCFSNFVSDFPSNELAARSLFWIGTYYESLSNYSKAEDFFQSVWTDSKNATLELKFHAHMEAGKSAWSRQEYGDGGAAGYFGSVATNKEYPVAWQLEGQFAWADATMYNASATNLAHIRAAAQQFAQIASNYPGYAISPPAWARLGDCYLQLAVLEPAYYAHASNAYSAALGASNSTLSVRCLGEWGIAQSLKNFAATKQITDLQRKILLDQAKEHCLNIVYGNPTVLRDGEQPDLAWVKDAGIEAGQIMELLEEWDQAFRLYQHLHDRFSLPSAQTLFDVRRENARKHLSMADG